MKFLLNKYWLVLVSSWFFATAVLAQDEFGLYDTAYKSLPTGTPAPFAIVATVIQIILGVIGVVALVLILYAGFQWMTSAGNEEKINQAKKIIASAIVGLVLIFSSYIIADFVFKGISQSITPSPIPGAVTGKACDVDSQCSNDGSSKCVNNKCQAVIAPCAGVCLEFSAATSNCTPAAVGSEACPAGQVCFVSAVSGLSCP